MGNLPNPTVSHALTGPELPLPETPLPDLLDAVAAARGNATALVAPDATCTFEELLGRVRRLARLLLDRGIGAEDIVAVLLPRTSDSIVALLAVLTAGATQLPVDGGYPQRRITAMLTDARPHLLITTSAFAVPPECGAPVLLLDDPEVAAALAARSPAPLGPADRVRPIAPQDAAYVLFTSGSTGRPKGIVVEHRSLANLLASHRGLFFGPATAHLSQARLRVAHTAAQSFDASWDPVLWLFEGHELHLVDDTTRRDPSLLVEYLVERRVDVVETTPTFAEQLDHNGLFDPSHPHRPGVLALGGEDVGPAQWRRLRTVPHLLALNLYGPSECTVDAFLARLSAHPEPTIGLPIANSRAYVLDEWRRPSPPGETGELYLAGPGVARGYLQRPELTAERFLADPWWPEGGTMYRTGDLVRRASDGTLVFEGRVDGQVKLRGQRLELGEIEAVLLRHTGVAQAVVVLHEEVPGVPHLVAYVVPSRGQRCVPGKLLAHAAGELASYMVPSAVVPVDALPLTPNGKLDRAALPPPLLGGPETGPGPGTPTERLLCQLFSDALGGAGIGPQDDFFERGGDSMAAIRVVSAARERGLALRLQDVLEHRRAGALAEAGEAPQKR